MVVIKSVIDQCDYYLVIVGGRYGSAGTEGVGYTEMEYRYALDQGKPIIGFIPKDPGKIPVEKTDQDPVKRAKLEEFLGLVQKKMCRHWESPADLGSVVTRSLLNLIRSHPAVGWVRADQVPDKDAVSELLRLRK